MKTTIKLILSLLAITVIWSCSSDDDNNQTTETSNSFDAEGTTYNTQNAFLVFDDGSPYGNSFFLNFLNGTLIEDSVNGVSVSTNLTHGAVLFVDNGGPDVATEQDISIINGTTYSLENVNTTVLTQVSGFVNTHTVSGTMYGEPDLSASNEFLIQNSGNGTITINTITVDYTARTGTVDCTYQLTDDNGVAITGQYNGTFNIINGI